MMSRFSFVAFLVLLSSSAATAQLRLKGTNRNPLQQQRSSSSSATIPFRNRLPTRRILKDDKEKDGLPKKRDCKLTTKDNSSIEYECTAESFDSTDNLKVKDKIRFRIDTSKQGTRINVQYSNKVDSNVSKDSKDAKSSPSSPTPAPKDNTNANQVDNSSNNNQGQSQDGGNNNVTQQNQPVVDTKEGAGTSKNGQRRRDMKSDLRTLQSTETTTEYEIIYDSIVEYMKGNSSSSNSKANDNNEAYDMENDVVLQKLSLSNWANDMADQLHDDGTVTYFTATTSDGIVQFNYTISRSSSPNNTKVSANHMKIDMTVANFPWKSKNSYLALISSVSSTQRVTAADDNGPVEAGVLPTASSSSSTSNNNPPAPKRPKQTTQIDISFKDALKATNGFVTMGSYTWEKTAKATTRASDLNNNSSVDQSNRALTPNAITNATNNNNKTTTTTQPPDNTDEESDISVVASTYDTQAGGGVVTANDVTNNGGNTNPVVPTNVVAFSFVGDKAHHARKIYWDPEAGISYQASSSYYITANMGVWGIMIGSSIMSIVFHACA